MRRVEFPDDDEGDTEHLVRQIERSATESAGEPRSVRPRRGGRGHSPDVTLRR